MVAVALAGCVPGASTRGDRDGGVDAGRPDGGVPEGGVADGGVGADAAAPDAAVDGAVPDAGVPDAGAPDAATLDGGGPGSVEADGGAADAGAADVAPEVPVEDPALARLRAEVEALARLVEVLERLVAGELPRPDDPVGLVEVDPLDEDAVAARIAALAAAVEGARRRALEPADGDAASGGAAAPGLDAGAPGADAPDGGAPAATAAAAAEGPAAGGDEPASPVESAAEDAPPDAPAAPADADTERAALEARRDDLAARRDALRLVLLERPREERAALADAIATQARIRTEQGRAATALAAAEAEARSAEKARNEALAEAAQETSILQSRLAAERARLESARAAVAARAARLAEDRAMLLAAAERWVAEGLALERDVRAVPAEDPAADALFDGVVPRLGDARDALADALGALGAAPDVPDYAPTEDLDGLAPAAARDLASARRRFESNRRRVVRDLQALRRERVEDTAAVVDRLDAARLALLPRLTPETRQRVLGLDPAGLAQLRLEASLVAIRARGWALASLRALPGAPAQLGIWLARATTRGPLLFAAFLGLGALLVRSRRGALEAASRSVFFRAARRSRLAGAVARAWPALWDVLLHVAFWLAVHAFFDALAAVGDGTTLRLLRLGATTYAAWRLAFRVAHHAVAGLAGGARLRRATRLRIEGSARLVTSYLFLSDAARALAALVAGEGYVHGMVALLTAWAALPVGIVLLRRWREPARSAYLARHASTELARRLREGAAGLRGYALVLPAMGHLAFDGMVALLRRVALRFEQSRRAAAYLFRRRLERRAESIGLGLGDVQALPEPIRAAFADVPAEGDVALPHFPGIDAVGAELRAWRDGGPGVAVAISGERGVGKTTWLREAMKRGGIEGEIHDLPHGLWRAAPLCRYLSGLLGVEPRDSVDALVAAVDEAEIRACVVLDACQNAFLRTVGGAEGFEALIEVAARTEHRVAWVCAFSRYGWQYLQRVEQAQGFFDHEVALRGWTEEKIAQLIHHRMSKAGYLPSYEDLLVEDMEGTAARHAVIRTGEEFLRLLWDYADGNPRVAMRFWLRSLAPPEDPSSRTVRVRLFDAPSADALEPLHEETRFLLAAVVLHENLSLDEAESVLRLPRTRLAALFAFLQSKGYLEVDEVGAWRVTTPWYRAVVRHLKRKRLLFD